MPVNVSSYWKSSEQNTGHLRLYTVVGAFLGGLPWRAAESLRCWQNLGVGSSKPQFESIKRAKQCVNSPPGGV